MLQGLIDDLLNSSPLDFLSRERAMPDQLNLEKRLTPAQIAAMQSQEQAAAQAQAQTQTQEVGAAAATTQRVAAQAATHGTTIAGQQHATTPVVPITPATSSIAAPVFQSPSTAPLVIRPSTSSAILPSTSSLTPSTSSSIPISSSTSTTPTVLRITETPSTSSTASPIATVSATPDKSTSTTSHLSTPEIAGCVAGALVALLILGALAGWLYRKYTGRAYSTKSNWNKIEDDDVTPFPPNEKLMSEQTSNPHDDIYGSLSGPVIGSRRALATARNNAFNTDGTFRPDSDYLVQQQGNRAGFGVGHTAVQGQGPYVTYPARMGTDFGDAHSPQAMQLEARGQTMPSYGRVPVPPLKQSDQFDSHSPYVQAPLAQGNVRQLVGPSPVSPSYYPTSRGPGPSPVDPFRRQYEPPQSLPYSRDGDPYILQTASGPQRPTRPGDELRQQAKPQRQAVPPVTPPTKRVVSSVLSDRSPPPPIEKDHVSPLKPAPVSVVITPPAEVAKPPPLAPLVIPKTRIPSFGPMSPLMSGFDLERRSQRTSQLLALYADENPTSPDAADAAQAEQKRMYKEVASAAGVAEPPTPKARQGSMNRVSDGTSMLSRNMDMGDVTASSFSAHEPSFTAHNATTVVDTSFSAHEPSFSSSSQDRSFATATGSPPRLPTRAVLATPPSTSPPRPYVHGQPLSPLAEVETPRSVMSALSGRVPQNSPSKTTGKEENPFERTLQAAAALGPKGWRASQASIDSLVPPFRIPSPNYPPPSPGGMSVPGSVSDSPRRWSGQTGNRAEAASRGVSVFYGEDAYGGI